MPAKPLTAHNLSEFERRIQRRSRRTQSAVGAYWNQRRCCRPHLNLATALSLGEIQLKDTSTFFTRHILKRIVFQTPLPWPKGKIKVSEVLTPKPQGSLEDERVRLIASIKRFVESAEREPKRIAPHPFFGPFTLQYWQLAHGKHFNHHFEQFGV